jgi:hypothetical protein
MDCDVFKFDAAEPVTLKRSDLEDLMKQAGGRKKMPEKKAEADEQ